MVGEHRVRLVQDGESQALRIPEEYRLDADEVVIHRDSGGRLIIEPAEKRSLLATLAHLPNLDEPFPDVDTALPPVEDEPL